MSATEAVGGLSWEVMESRIRRYFDDCNSGDIERVASNFEPHGVHYFPPGTYEGPFRGAHTIGAKWHAAVRNLGSYWTVDQVLCDPRSRRGDEWYVFSARGLIEEIRAYYASPQDPALKRLELGGFDYAGRGYPLTAPWVWWSRKLGASCS